MTKGSTPTVRTRRGSELLLILFALLVGMFAYANVGLAVNDSLPTNFYVLTVSMAVIAIVVHLIVRRFAPYADPLLIPIALFLNCIGLAMIYRIDLGSDTNLASKQLMWTAVGVAAACLVLFFIKDHRILRRYSYVSMIVGLLLAVSPLLPGIGHSMHGANIWVKLGPFSLQPAELSKIFLAIFFAAYLVDNRDRLAFGGPKFMGLHLPRMRDFGPIILVWIASLLILISQRDLGTSLLFFGLFVAMLYLATERTSWIVIGGLMFAAGVGLVVSKFAHVQQRFDGWLHAMDSDVYDRVGGSYQLVQGMFGMASGGLFGTGWGQGRPFVTFSYSDFIFPSLGEELGLVGLFAILTAYMLFVQRGFRIAISTRDGFGKLLAGGLAFVIAWQCFVVIGGVTRLIPLTGLTTPFLAYGGSSLLANWIIVGILLRISDNARRPVPLPLRGASTATPDESGPDLPVRRTSARAAVAAHSNASAKELDTAGHDWAVAQDAQHTQVVSREAIDFPTDVVRQLDAESAENQILDDSRDSSPLPPAITPDARRSANPGQSSIIHTGAVPPPPLPDHNEEEERP